MILSIWSNLAELLALAHISKNKMGDSQKKQQQAFRISGDHRAHLTNSPFTRNYIFKYISETVRHFSESIFSSSDARFVVFFNSYTGDDEEEEKKQAGEPVAHSQRKRNGEQFHWNWLAFDEWCSQYKLCSCDKIHRELKCLLNWKMKNKEQNTSAHNRNRWMGNGRRGDTLCVQYWCACLCRYHLKQYTTTSRRCVCVPLFCNSHTHTNARIARKRRTQARVLNTIQTHMHCVRLHLIFQINKKKCSDYLYNKWSESREKTHTHTLTHFD